MNAREHHARRLLAEIEADSCESQRSLARKAGIALGLTNLILKQLARKGWIRVVRIKPNRVRYLITPSGIAQKARMSRAYFQDTVRFYREARDRVLHRFAVLSAELDGRTPEGKRVVFYGAGEVAEVGYICLPHTDLQLVGVVDESRCTPFFGLAVDAPELLQANMLAGRPFDRLVVMSFGNEEDIEASLRAHGVDDRTCFWI